MSNKRVFNMQVTYTNSFQVTCNHKFTVLAETKYEAIERALTRYREVQPDRTKYEILSHWSYNTGKTIAILAMSAFHYSMDYS